MQLVRDGFDALAQALAAEPARVDAFLASSWRAQLESAPPGEPWWLATRPQLPALLLQRARAFVEGRSEPEAGVARGLLAARREDFAEAWRELEGSRDSPSALVIGLRALSLAHLQHAPQAREELERLERLLRAQNWTDAELEFLADEVRAAL